MAAPVARWTPGDPIRLSYPFPPRYPIPIGYFFPDMPPKFPRPALTARKDPFIRRPAQ